MDLNSVDRERLAGSVEAILSKGGLELDALMVEVRKLVTVPSLHNT